MFRNTTALIGVAAVAALTLTACSPTSSNGAYNQPQSETPKVTLLLPETATARYENQDRPSFIAALEAECAECEVESVNAEGDAAKQLQQAEAALTAGATVLVVAPVDSEAASAIAKRAADKGVPVVAYVRPILNAPVDAYVAMDVEKVGEIQGQFLVDELETRGEGDGTIVMINGAASDANSAIFKSGAHSAIDASELTVGMEFDTPDWSPEKAQAQMDQAITKLGADAIVGVYSTNDGMYAGAVASMLANGVDPSAVVSTGLDADIAALQRILSGTQSMTVYNPIADQAGVAATIAAALAQGKEIPASVLTGETDNGAGSVATALVSPQLVTADTIADTVIADGFWTIADICVDDYAAACAEHGLK